MKKQDNTGLIQELTERLDWYMMEASDEEFDAEQVQALMKLLDSLKSEDEKKELEEELPVEEAVSDFWSYQKEREEEERLLFGAEENGESVPTVRKEEEEEHRESKFRRVLWYFHRHRLAVVTAAILVVVMLGGSWQVVANAEKHGGFFWWMDRSEEGTTMITAPDGLDDSDNTSSIARYYSVEKVPEEYKEYIEEIFEIHFLQEYEFYYVKVVKGEHNEIVHVFMKNDDDIIRFEIKIYPKEILRAREIYPGFDFEKEFENEGISFDVFSKKELSGENTYLMYFYYDKEKYIVMGSYDENDIKDIAIQYKNVVLSHNNIK